MIDVSQELTDLMDELDEASPEILDDFLVTYPQLRLVGDEWLRFCDTSAAWFILSEIEEELEDMCE